MGIQPRIEELKTKKLIGYRLKMSLANNQTGKLWGSFVPRIKEIGNRNSNDKISMQIYDSFYFADFNPNAEFEKWVAVEVESFEKIPKNMESFTLKDGAYAIFEHKGDSSDNSIFHYIFTDWLPNSKYELDNRPHFEVLGEKYKNNDPNSEEEIWIPVKEK
ncbi:MAG: AraC family transcriptional regulator [Flammeovirgaceae bacterium]|jgi:AraC family transcriptional regulator